MNSKITFHKPCDLLICGSTLFAIDAALSAAVEGRSIVLAMERTNPFIECIPALRSHISLESDHSLSNMLKRILLMDSSREENGRVYFNPHAVAKLIEDCLIEAGVKFYYNAMPVSGLMTSEGIGGAVFGGKPGLFAVEANEIWDCTLNSVIARTAGVGLKESDEQTRVCYSVELSAPHPEQRIKLSDDAVSGEMHIHKFFADFDLILDEPCEGPLGYAKDFNKVYDSAMNALDEAGILRFRGADAFFHSGHSFIENINGRVEFSNLAVFGPMSISGNSFGQCAMKDPLILHKQFGDPTPLTDDEFDPGKEYYLGSKGGGIESLASESFSFTDPGYDAPATDKYEVGIGGNVVTVQSDLLIAGCGTSGVAAAFHAGRLGLNPLCIDGALEAGGAATVGGVTNLWYGNETKAFQNFYKECGAANDELNAWPFRRELNKQGVEMLLSTSICGTSWKGRTLKSVFIITPEGMGQILSYQFIDATGDGTLATWSGNDYTYGSERDGVPSWGSFGNFFPGEPEARRQFLSMVDERSANDSVRFIVAMRRSLPKLLDSQPYIHPAFYIAPRTSRHIEGKKTVTYEDMLSGRRFRDTVLRCKSNIDTKGTETSNAFKVGFYPYGRLDEFEVSIPYSALIPLSFDNLIIVGKAYSITNDALTMARMQRDLFLLGMIASEAVNVSKKSRCKLPDISVGKLQLNLIDIGALQEQDISDDDFGFQPVENLVHSLIACNDLKESLQVSAQLLLLGKEEVLPILEHSSFEMTPTLARLLCFWKVDSGISEIRRSLENDLSSDGLPVEFYSNGIKAHMLPDHGFAPMTVLKLNNLALAGDDSVSEFINLVTDRFEEIDSDYALVWAYIFGLTYAAERTASPELIESLEKILENPLFTEDLISYDGEIRECADIERERYIYLRLCIGRALARCGSLKGLICLTSFLDEARTSLAVNAKDELEEITGQGFGYDVEAWHIWIEQIPGILPPTPVLSEYH